MKYYNVAKEGTNIASLRYINTLIGVLLSSLSAGQSDTTLWQNITLMDPSITFKTFLTWNINICINNFNSSNNEIIDYSL